MNTEKNPSNTWENPMHTDGFEFVEYCAPEPQKLVELFLSLGFVAVAKHRSKKVTLYRQGDINFLVNAEPNSFGRAFSMVHGPSICAFAIRVGNAEKAFERARQLGAEPWFGPVGDGELKIPAIKGIGGSLIYFVDTRTGKTIYDVDFVRIDADESNTSEGVGLWNIDHLTHNVHRGRMDHWAGFYERLFNFREIRYFDIEGKLTGLRSRAMTSPCGKIRIPINESADDKSQIEEFLHDYSGEGVQHIALSSKDIYRSVEILRQSGTRFLDTPESYYDLLDERLPGHGEDLERMRTNRVLMDGTAAESGKAGQFLLQIFTETVIGPIFFELIQRKGDEGFGEGNFKALFDSIELDQVRRGVLRA
jgi:4-hydroxyphenylpyruvate dioxygenase